MGYTFRTGKNKKLQQGSKVTYPVIVIIHNKIVEKYVEEKNLQHLDITKKIFFYYFFGFR